MACLTVKEKTANFTHNVKWLREHYGYSKTRMAKILKISTASLERIENGELPAKLNMNVLFRIGDFFGVDPGRLTAEKFENG